MSKLAIIFPREGPKSLNKAMVDISIKYYTAISAKTSFLFQTMGNKSGIISLIPKKDKDTSKLQWVTKVLRHLVTKLNI